MAPTVAVIGGGPVGLMALKNLREDGFDAIIVERRPYVGGLWRQSSDSTISVTENTMFNTSRFRAGMTDFPMKDEIPDYPTAKDLYQYFDDYTDHFNLRPYIRLGAEVKDLQRVEDKWAVEIEQDGVRKYEPFDKVVCATGSMVIPKSPSVKGIENFKGSIIHAIDFPTPAQLEEKYGGQNVLLIGLSATAQDVITDLAPHAKKVYVSHRHGVLLTPRYTPTGSTSDQAQTLKFIFIQIFLSKWAPKLFASLADLKLVSMHKQNFPDIPEDWNFLPAPSIATSPPLIADAFYRYVKSGFTTAVPEVKTIRGPKTVELVNGRILEDIDSIIYCTGYDFAVPCVPPEYNPYATQGATPTLYRNTFPLHPDPEVRNSLAFLGQAAVAFPGLMQFELAAMAISQVWRGKSTLPPLEEMKEWHRRQQEWREDLISSQKIPSRFHAAFMPPEHIQWLDKTAGTGIFDRFGFLSWKAWKFWWTDPELYRLCLSGILTPAIWRLFETGKRQAWSGAKAQIIKDNEMAKARSVEKLKRDQANEKVKAS